MLDDIDVAMGGRVAEELKYGEEGVSSGASSDMSRATSIAEDMVMRFGFSDKVRTEWVIFFYSKFWLAIYSPVKNTVGRLGDPRLYWYSNSVP